MIIAQSKISSWTHAFEAINIPNSLKHLHFCQSILPFVAIQLLSTEDIMNAYVGVEGFLTQSGFILKELCIYYDREEYDHYLFKRPGWQLTEKDVQTIRYASSQLNGLHINDGCIPYQEIAQILNVISGHQIYTFSDLAVSTLRQYLPNTRKIKNIQDMGFEMPKNLPNSRCFRSHRSRYCAKSKACKVRDFMKCFD